MKLIEKAASPGRMKSSFPERPHPKGLAMNPYEQNHEGRLLAMHLVLVQLLAASEIDLEKLHGILTSVPSMQPTIGDTPERIAGNAVAVAATAELDNMFSAATHYRRA